MFNLYDYKKNGAVITTIRAQTLTEADAAFQKQTGIDPGTVGLHIRQCPEELQRIADARHVALAAGV